MFGGNDPCPSGHDTHQIATRENHAEKCLLKNVCSPYSESLVLLLRFLPVDNGNSASSV